MGLDLLETFPETDKNGFFAYGMSMGGIRSALAFGVEPRIKRAGVIIGGGDIPGMIADTRYTTLSNTRDARMLAERIPDLESFRVRLKNVMSMDPLDFACLREPEDFMQVLSTRDNYVNDVYQKMLYDAFSKPQEGRFPSAIHSRAGHFVTGAKFLRYVNRLADFFAQS
jgi:hypothetical protein